MVTGVAKPLGESELRQRRGVARIKNLMTRRHWKEELGPADIRVGKLQIWVHTPPGLAREDTPGWTWLRATAHYAELGASVWVSGEILTLEELECWLLETQSLLETPGGRAALACTEPYLAIELAPGRGPGRLAMTVGITPDVVLQAHHFETEIDRGDLPVLVGDLERVTGGGRHPAQ